MVKQRTWTLLLLLFFKLFENGKVYAKDLEPSIKRLVKRIERQPSLFVNYKLTSKNIRLAKKLSLYASHSDLLRFTKSENKNLVGLAFLILATNNHPSVDSIFNDFTKRSPETMTEINRLSRQYKSDIIAIMTLENFFYEVYKENRYKALIK